MSNSVYLALPLMALLTVVQAAILPQFPLLGMVPQLGLLAAVSWGLLRGSTEGVVWAFVAGVFLDLFSSSPMGASALALMVAVLAVSELQRVLPENRFFLPVLLSALATFAFMLLYLLLLRLTGYGMMLASASNLVSLVVLHAFLILPVYWLLHAANRVLNPPRVEV